MRRGRNPRRGYDENGREITPPTVGDMCAQGDVTAAVTCRGCRRNVVVPIDRFPADLPFPDIALRLVCSTCGSRDVGVMMDMQAHYARLTAETGWKMEVKPWPKVEGQGADAEKRPEPEPGAR